MKVGKFKFKNNGGFVARVAFIWHDNHNDTKQTFYSKDIILGKEQIFYPKDYGVNNNSHVSLYVKVVAGNDKESDQMFEYCEGSENVASFFISGTTLNNNLGFLGVEEKDYL